MADETNQKKAFDFLVERLASQEAFTKEDLQVAAGWSKPATINTYLSKQFKPFLRKGEDKKFRVTEGFRKYTTWKKFRRLVTQVKGGEKGYAVHAYSGVVIFEFFMHLANEEHLRTGLDSLFFRDRIMQRLTSVDLSELKKRIPSEKGENQEQYYDRICQWVARHFGGYSISHVSGRFRGGDLLTMKDAADLHAKGQRYLIDETTAIVRFIFRVGVPEKKPPAHETPYYDWFNSEHQDPGDKEKAEADKVRWFFGLLFITSIIELVDGEEEVWMVESGMRNRLHIWSEKE